MAISAQDLLDAVNAQILAMATSGIAAHGTAEYHVQRQRMADLMDARTQFQLEISAESFDSPTNYAQFVRGRETSYGA